jgi:hypothetical protein
MQRLPPPTLESHSKRNLLKRHRRHLVTGKVLIRVGLPAKVLLYFISIFEITPYEGPFLLTPRGLVCEGKETLT